MARAHKYIVRFAIAVLIIAFFLPEPWNEFTLYVAWTLFGVAVFLWGISGILTRHLSYQVLEMWMVGGEGETKGGKAVFVGILAIVFALITFIIPGFALALGILYATLSAPG